MTGPKNHHWLPKFMMSPWLGDDGRVNSFYRAREKVAASRKSLKSLGSQDDLYTISWVGMSDRHFMETEVFTKIFDTPNAAIRDGLISGLIPPKGDQARLRFAVFLLSLITRDRDIIQTLKQEAEKIWWDEFKTFSRTVDGITRKMDQAEAESIYRQLFLGYGDLLVMHCMLNVVTNSPHIASILNLEWDVLNMTGCGLTLVLADNPLQLWGSGGRIERVWLPLSPSHLFVAGTPAYLGSDPILLPEFRQVLALQVIGDQFRKAREFVVSRDLGPNDGFLKIAEQNMRTKT